MSSSDDDDDDEEDDDIGGVYTYVYIYIYIYVYMYVYIYIYVFLYMYIFGTSPHPGGYKIVLPMLGVIIAICGSAGPPPRIVLEIAFS